MGVITMGFIVKMIMNKQVPELVSDAATAIFSGVTSGAKKTLDKSIKEPDAVKTFGSLTKEAFI